MAFDNIYITGSPRHPTMSNYLKRVGQQEWANAQQIKHPNITNTIQLSLDVNLSKTYLFYTISNLALYSFDLFTKLITLAQSIGNHSGNKMHTDENAMHT